MQKIIISETSAYWETCR